MIERLFKKMADDKEWCLCASKFNELPEHHKQAVRLLVDQLYQQSTANTNNVVLFKQR